MHMDILSLVVCLLGLWLYLFIFNYKVFESKINQVKKNFFITYSGPSAGLSKQTADILKVGST